MTDYDLLLPQPTISQVGVWATVTAVSPLRVQLDGDPGALPFTPDSLVGGLAVNDRVWAQLTTNSDPIRRSRRLVILGRSGGQAQAQVNPFPVGSIYLSVNATNPGTLFGGTWTRIQDRFLLAAGSTYAAGATGGEAAHVLTVAEMPAHDHPITYVSGTGVAGFIPLGSTPGTTFPSATGSRGGDQAHNNMPPYLAVYVWQRTA